MNEKEFIKLFNKLKRKYKISCVHGMIIGREKMTRKELIKKLKPYWKKARELENTFYAGIDSLEREMSKESGVPDLEIFLCDGSMVGIGNYDRTMKLIFSSELEVDKK